MIELTLAPQEATAIKLSIIIVCFNSREVLLPCLESIWKALPSFPFEVILVDNGSKDNSVQEVHRRFQEVIIIQSGSNAGYAGGNNIGFAKARGKYVLFLNPDTIIYQGAFDKLVNRADSDPNIGIVGPSVQNADGTLQLSCFRPPDIRESLSKTFWLYRIPGYMKAYGFPGHYREDQYKGEMDVDVVSGCCLLARKTILDEVGAFDEEYFIYYEETDLCERVRRSGYRIVYAPSACIVHLGGATTIKQEIWFRIQSERSRYRFFSKYRCKSYVLAIRTIQLINWIIRVTLGSIVVVLSTGRAKRVAHTVHYTFKLLCWQLGIVKQGERPS